MPTYEYACEACGHKFEEFQSIKAKPTTICPVCRKRKVKRLISAGAGFIFKGSGFYITDYRSDSYKDAAKNDAAKSAPATDSGSAAAKTETKPDAKTAAGSTATAAPPAAAAKTESAPAPKSEPKRSSSAKKSK